MRFLPTKPSHKKSGLPPHSSLSWEPASVRCGYFYHEAPRTSMQILSLHRKTKGVAERA
ncbi:hypothetical protein COLSTE_00239 [Collinsella stercoris DSM 13279]|uniref:Uncharacterized protein n=1 Tax=Collinsella stercoris DSM 13279 TaxID=445975 RepID=B6G848_9ACTN|nr:hypothetical protein COLSTE_00239 [Collinsella stercoris DSM 13279]